MRLHESTPQSQPLLGMSRTDCEDEPAPFSHLSRFPNRGRLRELSCLPSMSNAATPTIRSNRQTGFLSKPETLSDQSADQPGREAWGLQTLPWSACPRPRCFGSAGFPALSASSAAVQFFFFVPAFRQSHVLASKFFRDEATGYDLVLGGL